MRRKRVDDNEENESQHQPASKDSSEFLELATKLTSAYVSNNRLPVAEIPALIGGIHALLAQLRTGAAETSKQPAVPIKRSISDDYIICLEDGKKLRTLKRYLRTQYDLTPEQYRAKWGLPRDYPMVAPSYAKLRSAFAKKIGLGRIPAGVGGGVRKRNTG